MRRIKGSIDLLLDLVEHTTRLGQQAHYSPAAPASPVANVCKTIRWATDEADQFYDRVKEFRTNQRLTNSDDESVTTQKTSDSEQARTNTSFGDLAESALNGLYGDYLNQKSNALDIGMNFRQQGKVLSIDQSVLSRNIKHPTEKIVVFIHGLGCTESVWNLSAKTFHGDSAINFGSLLHKDLNYTPLFLRYNTGRHVSENGQHLSTLLSQLVNEYPLDPEKIVLVGHSMGGLVARSAAHYGSTNNEPWIAKLRQVVCLGTPNLGAPLEKGTNVLSSLLSFFDTPGTQIPADILNARSAGIKDLRFGYTIEDEWAGNNADNFLEDNRQDVPPVDGVGYYYLATTVTDNPNHPAGWLFGDLLVRQQSAAGNSGEPSRSIPFSKGTTFSGIDHLHITNHPQVYQAIKQYLL